jgi:hypothetical protein
MAGIPFLSKVLALAGIGVRNQTDNKEALINVSPSQPASSTISIDLPAASGQLAIKSEVVLASEKGVAGGVATLDGSGHVPSTQLPPYAISEVFVVADQAARLALVAQVGDIAVQTDTSVTYILQSAPPSVNSNWVVISSTNAVTAVNGEYGPGPITIDAADVGAVAKTGDTMSGTLTMGPISTGAGETGQIAFRELAANGIYSVTLRAPDALSDYVTLTLPTSHGSLGQVLTTDGSGILSWSTPAADSVTSVNGKVGVVVLNAADVGAVALTGDTMTGALVIGPIGTLSGETGVIRLKELASNGTSSISIRAADEMAANVTLTLPNSAGLSGQVLSTNGSGALSWVTLPADAVTSVNGQTGIVVLDTDDISESVGATNLWFTNARAQTAAVVNSTAGSQIDQAPSVSAVKAYVAASSPVLSVAGKTGVVTLSTSDVSEGTNLYFTDGRAQSAAVVNSTAGSQTDQAPSVSAIKSYIASSSPVLSVAGKTGIVTLNTNDVSEGTNLYFTDGRAQSAAVVNSTAGSQTDQAPSVSAVKAYVAASSPVLSVAGKTGVVTLSTSDISEGTNLYFTDARAQAAITGGASSIVTADLTASRALISNASGKVAVSSVTSAELGYLSGVTSAVQTQIDGKVSKSGDTMTGALVIGPIGTLSGETGVISLGELAANGSDTISLRAPDALASSVTLTLPSTAGSAGQYLTTNGSGVLSWSTGTDSALSARVDKLEASRGVYTGSLNSGTVLNISSLVPSGAVEYPIVQIYKDEAGVSLQVNVEFSFNPTTKQITFGDVADGPINAVIHVLALTAPLTTL